jgi:hypothetical protein
MGRSTTELAPMVMIYLGVAIRVNYTTDFNGSKDWTFNVLIRLRFTTLTILRGGSLG